jgi:cytochrome oxidase Cu insertion factor (SCO1/SenC/PrrC family)
MTLDALRKMDTELQSRGIAAEFVLVTLDPRTDTPERLHRWKSARNLGASYHLLSGTESGARALARYLNVNAAYDSGHIDHDVQIALFDASGRETRKYTGWSFDPADMAMGARGAPGGDPMSTGETR